MRAAVGIFRLDAVKHCRGAEDGFHFRLFQKGRNGGAPQLLEDCFREACGAGGFSRVRIGGAGGCMQARICCDRDLPVCRQAEPPLIPQTGCPERELTVRRDSFGTFAVDRFLPVRESGRVGRAANGFQQN